MNEPQDPAVQALLQQLNNIVEPDLGHNVAIGWWLLLVLILALTTLAVASLIARRQKRLYRLQGQALLELLEPSNDVSYAKSVNQLLKRVAMHKFGRTRVAPLYGNAWVDFLDSHRGKTAFEPELKILLSQGLYTDRAKIDGQQLQRFARLWIRQHTGPSQQVSQAEVPGV